MPGIPGHTAFEPRRLMLPRVGHPAVVVARRERRLLHITALRRLRSWAYGDSDQPAMLGDRILAVAVGAGTGGRPDRWAERSAQVQVQLDDALDAVAWTAESARANVRRAAGPVAAGRRWGQAVVSWRLWQR
ncbi:hypothetical protein [Rhodococcus opacus]|uniref:hypothetical protein n=1 Tax=Rhodococcus opacus TaxID=37919 RepID=UPI0006BB4B36|nr:hypothetical protein [Rhodococcus opacus]